MMQEQKPFEILSHTADIRLRVFGRTKKELFKNAVLALSKIQKSNIKNQNDKLKFKEEIKLRSSVSEILLVDFLNEVLAKSNINKAIYRIESIELGADGLMATLVGRKVDKFDEDVKAVTHHDVKIIEADEGLETVITLDI